MAGRGRDRMPEIRGGQGDRRPGPDRSDRGACAAEFPRKVAALGESNSSYGFADDDLRPPGAVGNQPRWPVSQPSPPRMSAYPDNNPRQPGYNGSSGGPVSLNAPGVSPQEDEIELPPEGTPQQPGAR